METDDMIAERINTYEEIFLEETSSFFLVCDMDGNILTCSPAAEHFLGYQPHELCTQNIIRLVTDPKFLFPDVFFSLSGGQRVSSTRLSFQRKDEAM